MALLLIKAFLAVFSGLATLLSMIFMLSPALFAQIEEALQLQFGGERRIVTVIEGEIDFLNDWVKKNRFFFGPLLSVLAALNTRNAFFL